jgi:Cu-processing system permease protein
MRLVSVPTAKIMKYELRDVARSRWLLAYTLFFLVVTDALLRFGDGGKALISLTSIALFIIPLVALVFGTVFLDNAREFTELLLAQPIRRGQLYSGLYLGLTLPLALAFVAGVVVPFALRRLGGASAVSLSVLLLIGITLTFIFTGFAFAIASWTEDRLRRVGAAIGVWLFTAVLYDGLVLIVVMLLGDHPVERPMLAVMFANPVDLARVVMLLQLDMSALMGYTGAAFQQFFSGGKGIALAAAALAAWVATPVMLGLRSFRKRDF